MIGVTPHSDRNLILTGYGGPSQLIIARRIAENLTMPFVNYETRLEEHADLPMDEIRTRYGEARLKTLEAEVMEELILRRGAVMLISGQTLLHADYLARLEENGMIICMVATLDAILQRLHLAMGARYHNPAERAMALGQVKREWAMRKLPGIVEFDTTALLDDDVVESIAALWREQALLTRG